MVVEFQHSRTILKMPKAQEDKIVVVGPRKVGKSAMVVRFLTKRFINEYVENTEMTCNRVTEVDGEPLKVQIQDTSDKAMRTSVVEQQLRWADAIMMVYSITDADSFRQLKNTASKMMEKALDLEEREQSRLPPLVLVGNKGDLDFIRQVSKREGLELAEKLKCDFFESSAREGWSKLITRSENHLAYCSPSNEVDTISLFAGAAASVGMVGLPREEISREVTRCLTPTLTRRKVPIASQFSDSEDRSEKTIVRRWGSFHTLTRRNVNHHLTAHRTFPVQGSGRSSWNSSPGCSEDDLDDFKSSLSRSPSRGRKSSPSTLIGKLSPRLGRKFSKPMNEHKESVKSIKDDNNNNNNKGKLMPNSIAFGLSSTLMASAKFSETLLCSNPARNRLISENTNSPSNSSVNSACTSTSGSLENLAICEHDVRKSRSVTPTKSNRTFSMNSPVVMETPPEVKLHEQDFSSSEPFLLLCRNQINRHRIRSKSPTHKIMNGLKKIRSLTGEHGSNGQGFHKSHGIPTNGQNLLSVPIIKF